MWFNFWPQFALPCNHCHEWPQMHGIKTSNTRNMQQDLKTRHSGTKIGIETVSQVCQLSSNMLTYRHRHFKILTASLPCILIRNSFTGRDPRYRVRVSARSPVTWSNTVRSNTPFWSPILRYSEPLVPGSPSPPVSPAPISTIQRDSAAAGRACILNGERQSCKKQNS